MIKRMLAVGALGSVGFLGLTALPAGAASHLGPNVNLKNKAGMLKFAPSTLNLTLGKGKHVQGHELRLQHHQQERCNAGNR